MSPRGIPHAPHNYPNSVRKGGVPLSFPREGGVSLSWFGVPPLPPSPPLGDRQTKNITSRRISYANNRWCEINRPSPKKDKKSPDPINLQSAQYDNVAQGILILCVENLFHWKAVESEKYARPHIKWNSLCPFSIVKVEKFTQCYLWVLLLEYLLNTSGSLLSYLVQVLNTCKKAGSYVGVLFVSTVLPMVGIKLSGAISSTWLVDVCSIKFVGSK